MTSQRAVPAGTVGGARRDPCILAGGRERNRDEAIVTKQKTRAKAGTYTRGRRRGEPQRTRLELPVLPMVVGGVLVLVLVGLFVWYRVASGPSEGQPVANVQCNSGEQLATHYHINLQILYQQTPVPVPSGIGIKTSCLYWLHTHDDTGTIHVEAPQSQASTQFTLGQFFQVWGQPLSRSQVATINVDKGQQVKIWVDGRIYKGDPSAIVLKKGEKIVIEIGPPFQDPPPGYTWPSGYP
jgi:hypothetical protein